MVVMGVVGIVSFSTLVSMSAYIIHKQDKLERMSLMDNTTEGDFIAK